MTILAAHNIPQNPLVVKVFSDVGPLEPRPKKLLDQVRDVIRLKHYSIRTEEAYVAWIKCFIMIFMMTVRPPASS